MVARDDDALTAAARADERLRAGDDAPLLGVPITVKDALDVVGMPCRGGSRARQEEPTRDAEVVDRVKAAGAVVLAKTNMPELGLSYETDNRVSGRTDHPLDPARTPGGSSGGEGAVLGADGAPRAWCELYLSPDDRVAQVEDLLTLPAYRGHGYGSALVAAGVAQARTAGCDLTFLRVEADDGPVPLYRRLGFEPLGEAQQFHRAAGGS